MTKTDTKNVPDRNIPEELQQFFSDVNVKQGQKIVVKEAFAIIGSAFPFPTKNESIVQLMIQKMFDEPEELTIVSSVDGTLAAIHKRDMAHVARRKEIALQVFQKYGINPISPGDISDANLVAMRKEIDTALAIDKSLAN